MTKTDTATDSSRKVVVELVLQLHSGREITEKLSIFILDIFPGQFTYLPSETLDLMGHLIDYPMTDLTSFELRQLLSGRFFRGKWTTVHCKKTVVVQRLKRVRLSAFQTW